MSIGSSLQTRETPIPLGEKILNLNWGLVTLVLLIGTIGYLALYSAGSGNPDAWATPHLIRFIIGFFIMIIVALIDIRFWMRVSYLAYFGAFLLLIGVEIFGTIGMGAKRWIDLGFIQIQPSELMKIALIMALARYFNGLSFEETRKIIPLIIPALMVLVPAGLVLIQPNLGTCLTLCFSGLCVFFMTGARWWKFILIIGAGIAAIPVAWHFLHDYQKQRVLTFLDPERDPLGEGYNIIQSKIALGSGGWSGKGFMEGTQSHLNFLPEKQTDFIFTLLAEEWGFVGGMILLFLLALVFVYGYLISWRCHHHYGRILAFGIMFNFSLYVFINIAMVMGLLPVVGIPLPMVSYGGTVMWTVMAGFGLMMSAHIHRDIKIPRYM